MRLWRIAAETRAYAADDLSGKGAASRPGRWNDTSEPVLYCASTISLAVLETAAHVDDAGLPQNRYLIEIEVPERVWEAREIPAVERLPIGWDAIPAGLASVRFGSRWLHSLRSVVMLVPSVIVPEEAAALLNPAHPDFNVVTAKKVRKFEYNRLRRT